MENLRLTTKMVIYADRVRGMCISNDYYTCGTTDEYAEMLSKVDRAEVTETLMLETAKDILSHSSVNRLKKRYGCSEGELLRGILFYLYNDCCTTEVDLYTPEILPIEVL